ncbi:hypothetical protein A2U01_0032096 [Trifolium medium]|uniref:Uncharacterized protein n=1 Tax=Trifolium medium TaxID=97028 RepID=A0A392PFX2_9FABA|nr:hypothetical protein [Trifolium medium]
MYQRKPITHGINLITSITQNPRPPLEPPTTTARETMVAETEPKPHHCQTQIRRCSYSRERQQNTTTVYATPPQKQIAKPGRKSRSVSTTKTPAKHQNAVGKHQIDETHNGNRTKKGRKAKTMKEKTESKTNGQKHGGAESRLVLS